MKKINVSIIHYGLGNLRSVVKAFDKINIPSKIIKTPEEIEYANYLILPGVGAFEDGINGLKERNLVNPIKKYVKVGKPLFGICLGMQLLMTESEEFGLHKGLNLIDGKVINLRSTQNRSYKVPHVGWSQLLIQKDKNWRDTILSNISEKSEVYFVHSFYVEAENKNTLAITEYGGKKICAVIQKGNITGCQFHPEMSGKIGLKIYKNFCKIQ